MTTKIGIKEIKTYKGWINSDADTIDKYLNPGDLVDEEMYNYFLNILPPLVLDKYYLQVGGACDYVSGNYTYVTFIFENGNWIYKGECHKNQATHLKRAA